METSGPFTGSVIICYNIKPQLYPPLTFCISPPYSNIHIFMSRSRNVKLQINNNPMLLVGNTGFTRDIQLTLGPM